MKIIFLVFNFLTGILGESKVFINFLIKTVIIPQYDKLYVFRNVKMRSWKLNCFKAQIRYGLLFCSIFQFLDAWHKDWTTKTTLPTEKVFEKRMWCSVSNQRNCILNKNASIVFLYLLTLYKPFQGAKLFSSLSNVIDYQLINLSCRSAMFVGSG